jgi:hypothetical protein
VFIVTVHDDFHVDALFPYRVLGDIPENFPRRDETFQFRRGQGIDRLRIVRQPAEDLLGHSLRLRLVLKVF